MTLEGLKSRVNAARNGQMITKSNYDQVALYVASEISDITQQEAHQLWRDASYLNTDDWSDMACPEDIDTTQKTIRALKGEKTMNQTEKGKAFRKELASLINRYSLENGSNTPDFLVADYLMDCLFAFNRTMTARGQWYAAPDELSNPGPEPTAPSTPTTPFDPSHSIVVSWDYREQPNWIDIQEALRLYEDPKITTVEDTGDDQVAVIISNRHFSQEEATARYSLE